MVRFLVFLVRKNGLIFDYVLPNEEVIRHETVTTEKVVGMLTELV
ncbi:competence regulator inhibitor paratox [Streptococcus phocae]